jgi:hypothetical protein
MKKAVIVFMALTLIILTTACDKEDHLQTNEAAELKGYWVNPQLIHDSIWSLERAEKLMDNEYGFGLLPKGKFIQRAISGWCATPPVVYADYKGDWSTKDSVVSIKVAYWGGTARYKWKIVSYNNVNLKVFKINETYN